MKLYIEKYRTPKLTIAYPSETIDHHGATVTTVWMRSEPRKYPAGQKNATRHNINLLVSWPDDIYIRLN